ncbi:hypothetical protein [Hymenobacter actinosclerus]|uniref:Uncharacterized protein n=1 Tax=Hymenobacter actinosclerus TaxID=82805 RepID=A0A1H9Z5G2_9BACT|nr:hypothetical protein [Hymenobacter actinosclerus]SES76783.1 hypothetical protein SAMN04487998_0207 [Hymenobacter actinosclerus]
MTLSRRAASLFTGLLLLASGATSAQTAPGQPTLDEQKVQIWCAAARYVYDDNGRPNLKDKLNCGSSLKAFENSIKADSQKVYSLLYQPLEGRGTMYAGLASNDKRLQKLTSEIIGKLKSSAARRANPARMERLATLETALNSYVNSGTPIGDLGGNEPAANAADTTSGLDEATASAPADAGPADAGLTSRPAAASGVGESVMDKLFAPLALILALLSLVLFWLQSRKMADLASRMGRHRNDIDAVKSVASPGTVAGQLTLAQRREVEKIVAQRIAEELEQRPSQPAPKSVAASTPAPTAAPATTVPPVAAPTPRPKAEPATTAEMQVAEAPANLSEIPAPPAAIPAGSPTAAPHDEFESLVPPVQLPAPAAPETDSQAAAMPAEPAARAQFTRYVKVPVNGAFSEYDLSDEPQHDSIYELHFDPQWPELATFNVTPNPAIHAYAIQSAQYSLREACRYQQPTEPVTRIVTEEEGVLRKVAGSWQIEQKAAIRFE